MAKRQIKPRNSKTKSMSHRPQRFTNSYWHEVDGCWYAKSKVDIDK
jgi:hypothetical protein